MIELHYGPSPNVNKVMIFLEETRTPYRIIKVDILAGDQFKPSFVRISPNTRIPAIVDTEPKGGGAPISLFESGAILLYLAEKTGHFHPAEPAPRAEMLQWLFWQMAGLGPMAGQNHYFNRFALERAPLAIDRYLKETGRLYGVLDRRLADRPFVAGDDYGLADMACHPWIKLHKLQSQDLADFPHLKRWFEALLDRPAVARAYAIDKQHRGDQRVSNEERSFVFNQSQAVVDQRIRERDER